jgi:N-methylhydantoinase B
MDAITLEIMRHRFSSIAEEMGAALIRTAYSTNIKDRRDCSCALFSTTGELVAQAEHVPIHLGVLPWGVKGALAHIDPEELAPGDAIMHNDPYIGGTHVPDIIIFAPIFYKGKLVAFVGNLAHHVDVGGKTIGSLPPDATEIFQEGLRFPPIKIRKQGRLNQDVLDIHRYNVRTPVESKGDLLAQLAANNVGERHFIELCDEFGVAAVDEAIAQLADYCEKRMASELIKIPSGTYEFSDVIEGDGITDDLITIKVKIFINNGKVKIDFTGSSPQTRGPLNAVRPMTLSCVYYAFKTITDPSLPLNEGTFRQIEVITPAKTIINASFPSPTNGANGITCQRIVDVLLGALGQAAPEKICAACAGAMSGVQLGVFDSKLNMYYAYGESYGGGYGATYNQDGTSGIQTHMTNTRNAPIEVLESSLPVLVEKYGLLPNSEGPGKYRGGFGITRIFTVLAEEMVWVISSDRSQVHPWGMAGGKPANGAHYYVESNGRRTLLPSKVTVTLRKGDRLIVETSGGGGWGDPYQRSLEAVTNDILEELITSGQAKNGYGVVVDSNGQIDREATGTIRGKQI